MKKKSTGFQVNGVDITNAQDVAGLVEQLFDTLRDCMSDSDISDDTIQTIFEDVAVRISTNSWISSTNRKLHGG